MEALLKTKQHKYILFAVSTCVNKRIIKIIYLLKGAGYIRIKCIRKTVLSHGDTNKATLFEKTGTMMLHFKRFAACCLLFVNV